MNCYRNKPFDTNSLQFFLYNITCYKIPSKSDDSGISPVAQKEHMESLCVFCQVAYSSISCSSIISSSHSGWNLWIHSLNVIWHQSPFFIDIFTHFLSQTQQNLRFLFLDGSRMKNIITNLLFSNDNIFYSLFYKYPIIVFFISIRFL